MSYEIQTGTFANARVEQRVHTQLEEVTRQLQAADTSLTSAKRTVDELRAAVSGSGLPAARKTELANIILPSIKTAFETLAAKATDMVDLI